MINLQHLIISHKDNYSLNNYFLDSEAQIKTWHMGIFREKNCFNN